ncbi:MAG: BACON domain-containing protein [Alistipes sp.]|nr:BACON domain-containing protein [Alistipes sp.]
MRHILYYIEKSLSLLAVSVALLFAACQQPEEGTTGTDIKLYQVVNGQEVEIQEYDSKLEGEMYDFVIYSNIGEWELKPTFEEDNEWCKSWPSEGKNDARVAIKVFENKTAYPRTCEMNIVSRGQVMATIVFNQTANNPHMEFAYAYPDDTKIVNEFGESAKIRVDSNVEWKAELTYDIDWLRLGEKTSEYQELIIDENVDDEARTASVLFRALGTDIEHRLYISQGTAAEFEAASKWTIKEVLNSLENGEGGIADNVYVEGYVISDYTTRNFDARQMVIMDESNAGMCVEFEDVYSNIYPLNTKVTIHLKDLLFVADDDVITPTDGTFGSKVAGLPSSRVKFAEPSAGIAPIELTSGDDLDQYEHCLVTLKDVEFAVPYGTYCNVNEDFSLDYNNIDGLGTAYDYSKSYMYTTFGHEFVHPLRDSQDNIVELYTLRSATFRAARLINEGSGDITGVVMHRVKDGESLYHIRMRNLEDDQTSADPETRRAKPVLKIGPWTAAKALDKLTASVGKGDLRPSFGNHGVVKGSTTTSAYLADSWARCTAATYNESTNKWYPLYATAEGVTYYTLKAINWWDNNYNRIADQSGCAWVVNTTTAGIEGRLSFEFAMCSSGGGPRPFVVEYAESEDAPASEWTQVQDIISPNISVSYSQKLYTVDLPAACNNKQNLTIRLRVSANQRASTASATSDTGNNVLGFVRLSSR